MEQDNFTYIEANASSIVRRRTIHGHGINDAWYVTKPTFEGKQVTCAFYEVWSSMLARCYSEVLQARYPTYKGCTVAEEWLSFSNFKDWMIKQDWKGKAIDKDVLVHGNKLYSPGTCVFVTGEINNLLLTGRATRGKWPQGVHLHYGGSFQAHIGIEGKLKHIGGYDTPEEAEQAYLKAKVARITEVSHKPENQYIKAGLLRHAAQYAQQIN